jgi:phenylacetate-CoA ligase
MRDELLRSVIHGLSAAGQRGHAIIRYFQDGWLRQQVLHAAAHSPFYRQTFADHQVDPRKLRGAGDLPALGFFTYPKDLQAAPYRFLAVPRERILYTMSSTGTTGEPKIIFLTPFDWRMIVGTVANGLVLLGVSRTDVAQILFCFGNPAWMTGNVVQAGLERVQAFVLPTGNGAPVAKQIETMRRFGATVLLGTPSYLRRLTTEAAASGDLRSLGIRVIRLGAEPWAEELRGWLQEAWGAQVYDSYGMMELGSAAAGECLVQVGMHVSPFVLVEVVNPQTGQPLPRGKVGELVYTTVLRQGSPLLRYRSGDLGYLFPDEPCLCQQLPTERISRIVGRTDDMLFLGSGENLYPAQVEQALAGIPELLDFQVVITREGYRDRLCVRAEPAGPANGLGQAIIERLYQHISFLEYDIHQSETIAPLAVELLPPGALLAESPAKLRRLVDRRQEPRSR